MIKIYPSVLSADFSNLGEEIRRIDDAGADGIHLDVMDGIFVPNITFGMPIIKSIRKCSHLFYDVHLMIDRPERYVKAFAEAGADGITFHIESTDSPEAVMSLIHENKKKVGISVKPSTIIPSVALLKEVDVITVMSVEPGFGGQKYIELTNRKIEDLARLRYEHDLKFEIDPTFPILIYGESQLFLQIVNNLISNALKFNKINGKITIVTYLNEKREFVFEIKDTGDGISKKDCSKIFNFFTQVNRNQLKRQQGSGVGLALCKTIAQAHGGDLNFKSRLSYGSTFWFSIPQ